MRLGIRTRLFLASLGLVAAVLLGAQLLLAPQLDAFLTEQVREDLFVRLRLCAPRVREQPRGEWSRLARELGALGRARITLVDPAGTVLGDSEVPAERLGELDNHLSRPEVQQALRTGEGTSVRQSATLGTRMMYVALPVASDRGPLGVVRAAVSLEEVDAFLARLHRASRWVALLMLLAGAVLSAAAAHWTSRSLRMLTAAARTMTTGDLSVRTRLPGHDEVAALGQALDTLGRSLSASLDALRGERDLRDRILMGMREGVLLLDGGGRVLLVNPALRELLGLRAGVEGQPLLEAVRHAALKELLDRVSREGGEASDELEVLGARERRLRVHVSRLEGDGLLAVFFDVTDLRRLEVVRRDFVANASHELRTPIAAVRSASETLDGPAREDPRAVARFLDIIQRNSERLQRLVDDLLDLSSIESREVKLALGPVALAPAAERVASLFQERAQRRSLRLAVEVPAGLPPALADPRALEQVLTNLVDNAVKYATGGGAISIRAGRAGEFLELSVEDGGPGIEARHLPRLFERFYRVDPSRSRELGGTGLGLSIVKHLVEAMHGTVRVDSVLGRGSRFVVTLPVAPATP
ncbi:MAG TPA: ATP-binding protein [Myxococcales bacterium]